MPVIAYIRGPRCALNLNYAPVQTLFNPSKGPIMKTCNPKQLFNAEPDKVTIYDLGRHGIRPGQTYFHTYLILTGCPITELPDGFHTDGSCNLRDTRLTSLPQAMYIGGDLDITGTKVTSIPKDLVVKGRIFKDFI